MTSLALLAALAISSPAPSLDWKHVAQDRAHAISGIVKWGEANGKPRFLVVHDNKGDDDSKISLLTESNSGWKMDTVKITDPDHKATDADGKSLVKDLESLCLVPGKDNEVMAIGDRDRAQGWVYEFEIANGKAKIKDTFVVPGVLPDSDYEAFQLVKGPNGLVAAWADRGSSARPAKLSVSMFDLGAANHFRTVSTASITTPWPTVSARSIAELRVSPSWEIYVSSVTDGGDGGPFDSAIYVVASATPTGLLNAYDKPVFICATPGYKIEAMDFDAQGRDIVFATDDEDLGASLAWFQK